MNRRKFLLAAGMAASLPSLCVDDLRAQETVEIGKTVDFSKTVPPTPIAITGFSGEVASVLKFDLFVMGFTDVAPDAAQYILSGSNDANVQGQLNFKKSPLISKAYTGAPLRTQAHWLADDVVLRITGRSGIARTRIAFKVDTGRTSEIYVSDFDGHNAQAVTRDNNIVAAPCWVPGQLALYYMSYVQGPPCIFYQNLTSRERHSIANYAGGQNSSPAVSPDGKRVAMILAKSGSPDVYVCDADGSHLKQLTATPEDESSPCWSADGKWIYFAGKLDERRSLCRVSAAGGPIQRIRTTGVSSPSEPDCSPDGQWIAFTSQGAGFDVCVVPAEGGTATVLVAGEDPSWALNSRTVVFARRSGGNRVLSLLDVPTKQVKDAFRVSGSGASNSQPSWAR